MSLPDQQAQQFSSEVRNKYQSGLREYGDYMNSKTGASITGISGFDVSNLGNPVAKYQGQISTLLNEGVQGIGIEAGAKFLTKTVMKPAGDYLTPSDSQLAGRQLGEIAGKGLRTQELQDTYAQRGQQLAEDRATTQTQINDLEQQITRPELYQGTADVTGEVALSGKELSTGEINVSRSAGESFASGSGGAGASGVEGGVPTAFTQASELSRNVALKDTPAGSSVEMTNIAEGSAPAPKVNLSGSEDPTAGGSDVFQGKDVPPETFRPLNQTPDEGQLTDLKAKVGGIEDQQKSLSAITQEDIEEQAGKEAVGEAGAGILGGIGEGAGIALGALGTALDFAMPLAGLGLGIFGLFEAGQDQDKEQTAEAQAQTEKNTITTNASFAQSVVQTRPDFGKMALTSDLDTSKFGSQIYSHF